MTTPSLGISRMIRPRQTAIAALLLVMIGACGCAHQSVRHMPRKPWMVRESQSLTTRFWRFDYESAPLGGKYGVYGAAYPERDDIPDWATWIEELWLAAYLSDSLGRVIAKDLRVYVPKPLDARTGVSFEFILTPEELGQGSLYVTFGYRMMLSDGADRAEPPSEPRVFFASEGALTRL